MAMLVHRVMSREHQKNPWGFGPTAARWNPAGYPIIYTASHVSLCTTELMAIMGTRVRLFDWCHVIYRVAGSINYFPVDELPKDWNHRPHPTSTQEVGRAWLLDHKLPAMAVPSARLPLSAFPSEFNLLLNPLHPNLRNKVSVFKTEIFSFAMNE